MRSCLPKILSLSAASAGLVHFQYQLQQLLQVCSQNVQETVSGFLNIVLKRFLIQYNVL
jgi:hypothetical protein